MTLTTVNNDILSHFANTYCLQDLRKTICLRYIFQEA